MFLFQIHLYNLLPYKLIIGYFIFAMTCICCSRMLMSFAYVYNFYTCIHDSYWKMFHWTFFFWLYWCYNYHLKAIAFAFRIESRGVWRCVFLSTYGDTFKVWNSYDSVRCIISLSILVLKWSLLIITIYETSSKSQKIKKLRLSYGLCWFKIDKTNTVVDYEKGSEY